MDGPKLGSGLASPSPGLSKSHKHDLDFHALPACCGNFGRRARIRRLEHAHVAFVELSVLQWQASCKRYCVQPFSRIGVLCGLKEGLKSLSPCAWLHRSPWLAELGQKILVIKHVLLPFCNAHARRSCTSAFCRSPKSHADHRLHEQTST